MGTFLTKYQKIISQINYWALLFFVFWLPLKDSYMPPIMALWLLTWLLEGNFKKRFGEINHKFLIGALSLYMILTILYIFDSANFDDGIFQIQQKLSMFFYPFVLIGSNQMVKKNLKQILLVFILGNLAAIFYDISHAFFSSLVYENGHYYLKYWIFDEHKVIPFWELLRMRYNTFSYSFISTLMHPSYFSVYLIFSICILIQFLKEKIYKNLIIRIIIFILILLFTFFTYILQSRAGIISMIIVFILSASIEIYQRLNKKFSILLMSLSVIVIFFLFQNRILNKIEWEYSNATNTAQNLSFDNSDLRIQSWYASSKVIKEHFWLGTGPSNLTTELVKKYRLYGFARAENEHLNCHNQYLESFTELGIIGFLLILIITFYPLIVSIKEKKYLLFFLIVILSVNFMFESMLNRMSGVIFFMFFLSIFIFTNMQLAGQGLFRETELKK